ASPCRSAAPLRPASGRRARNRAFRSAKQSSVRSSFHPCLQRVVFKLLACLVEPHAAAHRLADRVLGFLDLLAGFEHLVFVFLGNHDNAVGVAAQYVAGLHTRLADRDGHIGGFDLDAVPVRMSPQIVALSRPPLSITTTSPGFTSSI